MPVSPRRLPFAQRHSAEINLAVALALIASSVMLAFVTQQPGAYVPVLMYGLATLRQSQGHPPVSQELSQALRTWTAKKNNDHS